MIISYTNISKNTAKSKSAYSIYDTSKYAGKTNFSTFEGNKCEGKGDYDTAAVHHDGHKQYYFEYCNVLKNSQNSTGFGTFCCYFPEDVIVNKCCFYGDLGKGKLFASIFYGSIIIKDCQIDSFSITGPSKYETKDIMNKVSFDFIPHFSTFLCEVKINIIYFKNVQQSRNYNGILQKFACMFNISCKTSA